MVGSVGSGASAAAASPRRKTSLGSGGDLEKRTGRPLLQHAGVFAVGTPSPRSMCSSSSRTPSQESFQAARHEANRSNGLQMPAYDALLEELLAHATGNSSPPKGSSSCHPKEISSAYSADATLLDSKASGIETFLTAAVGGSEYAEDDEEAWLHNLCNVVGHALKTPVSNQSGKNQTDGIPSGVATQSPHLGCRPEAIPRKSSPMASTSVSGAVVPEAGTQHHMHQSAAGARVSPPLVPGSTHQSRRPRPAGQARRFARQSSSADPPQCSRTQARERLISEQLKCNRGLTGKPERAPEERSTDSRQDDHAPRQKRLSRIGAICTGSESEYIFRRASARMGHLLEGSIAQIPSLELQKMFGSRRLEALPASDLPGCGRAAVAAWAQGLIGGERCVLELETAAPLATGALRQSTGRLRWHALTSLCGLVGSGAFVPGCGVFASISSNSPQSMLHEAIRAVRKEAALDNGPITIEELHLGLRALELRARSDDDSLRDGSSEGVCAGNRLTIQAWRELLRAYIETGQSFNEEANAAEKKDPNDAQSLARVLSRALTLGSEGVEQEARGLTLEALRTPPVLWEECINVLSAMARSLKEDIDILHTLGAYAMLGVDANASDAEIKKAYRDQCLLYHPDKGGDTAAFQELQRAYEKVVDERKRGIRPPAEPSRDSSDRKNKTPSRDPPRKHRYQTENGNSGGAESRGETIARETAAEIAAKARAEEFLLQVEQWCNSAREAADRAQAARNACEAASSVILGANRHVDATSKSRIEIDNITVVEAYLAAREASVELLTATRAVAEGAGATAAALGEIAVRLLPASGPIMDGDRAEELMSAATQCTSQASATESVALCCGNMAEDIADMLSTIRQDSNEAEYDTECMHLSLHVLSSTAQRGLEAVDEASLSADAAARVSQQILIIVRGVARTNGHAAKSQSWQQPGPPRKNTTQPESAPPRMPQGAGTADETQLPKASSHSKSPESRHSSRPQSREGQAKESDGVGTPRGGSMSGRARTDALVQRRLKLFEELSRLNSEVLVLQSEFLQSLIRCPPLLPSASYAQREHVFDAIGEYLLEAAIDFEHIADSIEWSTELPKMLPWLPSDKSWDQSALSDTRSGILRLGALLDMEALASLLLDEFLPMLLKAQPSASESHLRKMVSQSVQTLRNWISSKSQ